jgi:hypothetical protein
MKFPGVDRLVCAFVVARIFAFVFVFLFFAGGLDLWHWLSAHRVDPAGHRVFLLFWSETDTHLLLHFRVPLAHRAPRVLCSGMADVCMDVYMCQKIINIHTKRDCVRLLLLLLLLLACKFVYARCVCFGISCT